MLVLTVLFTMIMFLWLLSMLGAIPNSPSYSPWLAFFACLILGVAVFSFGYGWVVVAR